MASRSSEYVLDELLCFLGSPLFQVPVLSFMENNCLIFDNSVEDMPEYKMVHAEYKKRVDNLLEAFRDDSGLSHEQIIRAMKDMNARPELRDIFQSLFEQVLATDNYSIFVNLMIQKNIELQQQALMLIFQLRGDLPDSLQETEAGGKAAAANDDEILQAVIEQSKREYESDQKKMTQDEENFKAIIIISTSESARLQEEMKREQEKLSEALKSNQHVEMYGEPTAGQAIIKTADTKQSSVQQTVPSPSRPAEKLTDLKAAPPLNVSKQPAVSKPMSTVALTMDSQPAPAVPAPTANSTRGMGGITKGGPSSADAAASWLKSAQSEVYASSSHSQAVQAMAASMQGMSLAEQKKREAFLKEQRDKLMEMKKKEREKQLLKAEKSQPERPASARAARASMNTQPQAKSPNPEDEKKLAMRRAIASRIKTELLVQDQDA